MAHQAKKLIQIVEARAGIVLNGSRPWDPQIHDERLYGRIMRRGSRGLGEAYMDGWWEAEALDEFFFRLLRAEVEKAIPLTFPVVVAGAKNLLLNNQRLAKAFEVGEAHYDIGNDVYQAMLDKRLTYTCGYWKEAPTLEAAQEAKLELVCQKLGLKPGQKVLDIGCGWGSFLQYATEHYGISGVGITVSEEQVALGKKRCAHLPVEIRLQDYRAVQGTFDHVVSLGMFEHVGAKNYRTYMQTVQRCLADPGLFLLQTIGGNRSAKSIDPWIEKYIFPNAMLPSIAQIGQSIEQLFVMEDWHTFGADYDKTLMAWFANFQRAWPRLQSQYSERFYRMWKYYLLSLAGAFRARKIQLWQIVLAKKGVPGGYHPIR